MRTLYLSLFVLLLLALTACKSGKVSSSDTISPEASRFENVKLSSSMQQKVYYKNLPSASGLEYVAGKYYIVGDDSPYLYVLDEQYQLVQKHVLFDTSGFVNGRIPKAVKPDLESVAHFTYGRDEMLLLLGSGASAARNRGFLVNLSEKMEVQELDLSRFYTFLKRILKIETEGQLNIEGLAMDEYYTYLLQRPLATGDNVIFRFDTNDFKDFLLLGGDIPAAAVYHFSFPEIGQRMAGFSGAFVLDNKLFFTASVEDTPNAVDDGEVLGSYLGVADLRALAYATDPANPLAVAATQLKNEDGTVYKGKAESLVVKQLDKEGSYKAVVVSDDDQGSSELLEFELKVEK